MSAPVVDAMPSELTVHWLLMQCLQQVIVASVTAAKVVHPPFLDVLICCEYIAFSKSHVCCATSTISVKKEIC